MTVSVVTGKPGHGKTLYAVTKIAAQAKEQNRQVYYNGIADLTLDWLLLEDATQWHNPEHVPDGAIIVIDEAQRTFPPRSTGSKVPPHVQPFDTHRHRGLDIYLITQDPMLIDSFARNLAGEHLHVYRPFGTQQATVYRWEHVVDPDSRAEKNLAVDKSFFRYPKESFGLYKSATVHTVKRKLPWKIVVGIPLLVAVLALSVVVGYKTLNKLKGKDKPTATASEGSGDMIRTSTKTDTLTPQQYITALVPRLPGKPDSAPVYDEIAKPSILPILAGCVRSATSCKCYTQQGSTIPDTPAELCNDVIQNGNFIAYDSKTLGLPESRDKESREIKFLEKEIKLKKLKKQINDLENGIEPDSAPRTDLPVEKEMEA